MTIDEHPRQRRDLVPMGPMTCFPVKWFYMVLICFNISIEGFCEDLFCRTFVFLASGSIELWAWSWNCHVLLWIQWAKTPGTGMEELRMGTSLSARIHETRIGTLFSFWQWLRQCLVNLKNWAWTMNKVLSHSSEIVTLLSVLEEIYVAACGSFCVSAVPSEILELVWIHPRNVLVLGTSPILLHPNMYQLVYIYIRCLPRLSHWWSAQDELLVNIPNYPKLLT